MFSYVVDLWNKFFKKGDNRKKLEYIELSMANMLLKEMLQVENKFQQTRNKQFVYNFV